MWDAAREGFLVQHGGEGAKEGSGHEMKGCARAKREERWQPGAACVPGYWVMPRRVKEKHRQL